MFTEGKGRGINIKKSVKNQILIRDNFEFYTKEKKIQKYKELRISNTTEKMG